ncbi:MAG: hypothetical protein JJT81_08460 [Rubellimicrobium sp.]|nr:hypothetical protein [Rubellimicrobium sp.]
MLRFFPLLLLPLLAACDPSMMSPIQILPTLDEPEPEPPPPPQLPPAAAAVLPPGTPPSIVLTDNDGCFIVSVEVTDPPSGFPLRDAAGNRVCEEGLRPPVGLAFPDTDVTAPFG